MRVLKSEPISNELDWSGGDSGSDGSGSHEHEYDLGVLPFDSDLYGMTMCSMIRDTLVIQQKQGNSPVRIVRVFTTFFLLIACMALQVFLLFETKELVMAVAIHDIRIVYHKYETALYSEYDVTVNGYNRGKGPRNATAFMDMDPDDQDLICAIPLSQPLFIGVVLLIWTITCAAELRAAVALGKLIVCDIATNGDMKKCVDEEEGPHGEMVVGALPAALKAAILFFLITPRLIITTLLLYIGCRWLIATTSFADLLLNAVALEFVMLLKDSLHVALVSHRSKMDLEKTVIRPAIPSLVPGLMDYIGTFAWAFLALAWVISFTGWRNKFNGLQNILPLYRWDVHDVCEKYIHFRTCIDPPCPKTLVAA